MKKVISGFLVLALMLFNIPSMALADDNSARIINSTVSKSGKCGNSVYWKLYKDGTLEIYGNGPMWDYGLDGEPGYGTIYSADRTMYNACRKVATNVIVRDGVTTLGRWALPMYKKLAKVDLSECKTLESMNEYAIGGGALVTEVVLPSNVKKLEYGSLYGLAITEIDLSHTVIEEMISPFTYCVNLTKIVLPKTVKKLTGATSFIYCYSLEDLYIPSLDIEIGDDVFTGITTPVKVHGHINSTVKTAVEKANNPNVTFVPLCSEGEWELEVIPTCTSKGKEVKVCTDCGSILDSREVEPIGHLSGVLSNNVEPSCKEDITIDNYCAFCGEELPSIVIPKIPHTPSDWIVDKEPTCTSEGHRYKECKVCKEVIEEETIPKKSHVYSKQVIAPTCVEKGYSVFTCSCGHSYKDDYVKALGHTPSDWIVDKESSCNSEGHKHKECKVCKEVLGEKIVTKKTHISSDWIVDIEPTCTSEGHRYKECLVCKTIIVEEVMPKKAHTPSDSVVVIEPTCEICGESEIKCLDCGKVLSKTSIGPLGHDYSNTIYKPTCTEEGYTENVCSRCGHSCKSDLVDAKDHSASEWVEVSKNISQKVCKVCSEVLDTKVNIVEDAKSDEVDIDVSNLESENLIEEIVKEISAEDFKPKSDGLIVVNVGESIDFSKEDFKSLNKVTSSNVLLKTSKESSFLFTPSNKVFDKSEELVGKLKRVEVVDKINDTHYTFTYTDYEEFSLLLKPVIELSEDYDEAWLHYYSNVEDYFDYKDNLVAVDHVRKSGNYLVDINSSALYNSDIIIIDDKYYKNTIIDKALRALNAI